jgi:putative addiction module component (TIGR02574 family)
MAKRLKAMGQPNYAKGFALALHEHALGLPLKWKTPRTIFVNSMSDLFHRNVPLDFVLKVFEVMNRADWHTYQVLTKRSDRLRRIGARLPWSPHIWMGVSVETEDYRKRIDDLRDTGAAVKFLSLEPLLGPLYNIDLKGLDWVIVGGESGPGARPMHPAWVRDIRDRCRKAQVPFFFKQWGGVQKKKEVIIMRSSDELRQQIDQLSLSEKLLLVEDIWDSIARSNSELPLPEWQKRELERRHEEYKAGKRNLHDWQSVHEDIRNKYR